MVQTKHFADQKIPESRTVAGSGLRLCHVITHPKNLRGSGLRTLRDAELASSLGYEVEIITGWNNLENFRDQIKETPIKYIRLPALNKYIYPHNDLGALMKLYHMFRRKRYHVVHTHLAKAGILGRVAAGLARVPLVVHSVHGPTFPPSERAARNHFYSSMEKLAGLFTTHYIFWAQHLQDAFEVRGIGRQANKRVIYSWYDLYEYARVGQISIEERLSLRARWGLKPDDVVVGNVGRLLPAKGQEYALRACHTLKERHPGLKMVFVGKAALREEKGYLERLRSLTQTLGIADRVVFTGHQNPIAPYYRMFDVFIFPSFYEGISVAAMEAFLADLPVVAFDIPGMRQEALGDEAWLAPCYDLAALTVKLDQALNSLKEPTPEPNRIRHQARKNKVLETWSYESWSKNFQTFYLELAQDLRARGLK